WSFADIGRTFTMNGVNDKYDAADLGIIETNLLEIWFGEAINDLFPYKFFHLQEGAQSWIVLFAGLMLLVARREKWRGKRQTEEGSSQASALPAYQGGTSGNAQSPTQGPAQPSDVPVWQEGLAVQDVLDGQEPQTAQDVLDSQESQAAQGVLGSREPQAVRGVLDGRESRGVSYDQSEKMLVPTRGGGAHANVFVRPWWLVLLPTVANWLTVLISSPFAALPRYILPAVFILPLILVLPWLVWSCEDMTKNGFAIDGKE
ncbi:MAG: hypothetical protein IJ131_07705, partial [Eggerthellaceae bacterium]|nr:hypothetical protein [Eggerthellaceae bacterium]